MKKHRINYWSCSKFANWIRGEKKPLALEWGKWEEWREEQAKKRPWRFWIAEEVLDKIQDFVYLPKDLYLEIKYYKIGRAHV